MIDYKQYWEKRYKNGGNSGEGSRGYEADFKADIVNDIIVEFDIKTIFEMGVGDYYQLSLYDGFDKFVGYDISPTVLEICKNKSDNNKHSFVDTIPDEKFDMTMSIDVLYHLIDDDDFDSYMTNLFELSEEYVLIYATNQSDNEGWDEHIKHRVFTDWIKTNTDAQQIHKFKEPNGLFSHKSFWLYKNK